MMQLKIKGHSGCSLDIQEDENRNLEVVKGCKESYIPRLKRQCIKQESEYLKLSSDIVENVSVPYCTWDEENNTIKMRYINGLSIFDYLETATINEIKQFTKSLILYINYLLNSSQNKKVDKKVFIDKLEEIKVNALKNELIRNYKTDLGTKINEIFVDPILNDLKNYEGDIIIPIGRCHGDLTFSNIIFSDKYYLIDFLDSYIESPLQDIVKIRQDTVYNWSYYMAVDKERINLPRVKTVFAYIDRKIRDIYGDTSWWKWYGMIQYINLLRIVPYVKDKEVLTKLHYMLLATKYEIN